MQRRVFLNEPRSGFQADRRFTLTSMLLANLTQTDHRCGLLLTPIHAIWRFRTATSTRVSLTVPRLVELVLLLFARAEKRRSVHDPL